MRQQQLDQDVMIFSPKNHHDSRAFLLVQKYHHNFFIGYLVRLLEGIFFFSLVGIEGDKVGGFDWTKN